MQLKSILSNPLFLCAVLLRFKTISAACESSQFECDNGSCISQYDVCNGERNCPDGSDETALTCVSQRQHCTKPYFQCTYGACVIGTAGCNGVSECADGSDETRLRCGNEDDIRQHDRRLQGNCQENEFKCPSGICLDKSNFLCDGKDDCADGTGFDESVELCGHMECPAYSFKCGTGGCISGSLSCNGENDCYDGSDEAPLLCNTTKKVTTPVVTETPLELLGCPLPVGDERPILTGDGNRVLTGPITRGTVRFSCKQGHVLEGEESSYCAKKKWSTSTIPKCVKYCSTAGEFDGYSTKALCTHNGQQVDCRKPFHPPGTEVKFVCSTGFKTLSPLPEMRCMKGGYWNRGRQRCEQDCGQIATPITTFSSGGYTINNRVVPWHVGLYVWHNEKDYHFQCGGSLLTPDLVITAAHCVYDEGTRLPYSYDTFRVIAAKFYRNYGETTPDDKRRDVRLIEIAPGYKGRTENYYQDLALMTLDEPFELSNVIRPICVTFASFAEKESVTHEVQGKFAAWSIENKHELQFVPAVSKSNSECRKNLRDIQADKFCIFTQGKSLACQGDSGGGFTSELQTNAFSAWKTARHFLFGVISNAPNADQCAHSLTVMTNIQHFEDMILNAMNRSVETRS
ncbi:modular serine protease isoform X1 [Drosophila santomea]|uniref:modular serine protease isoform X1 n=1 Tax=Drosophila santomea TaxID=129105 RepID=UPI0019537421|nr:modular serine protease isoform X1 [Drosophila santomea]